MAVPAPHQRPADPPAPGRWSRPGDGDRIECDRDGRRSSIDLGDPRRGISIPPDALLGLDLRSAGRPTDHWLRGDDVTAVYEPDDARRLRVTAMWRLAEIGGGLEAWELVVSAQTSLPESDSSLAVVSDAEAVECLHGEWTGVNAAGAVRWAATPSPRAACTVLRRPGPTSVLVAVHPADGRGLRVRMQGGRGLVECRLFSSVVEKGVLLRGRVLAAIGPAGDDVRWATAAAEAFAASPPMLST